MNGCGEEPDDYEGPLGRKNDPVYEIAGYVDEEGVIVWTDGRTDVKEEPPGSSSPSVVGEPTEPTCGGEHDTNRPDAGKPS